MKKQTPMQQLIEHLDDVKGIGALMNLPPKGQVIIRSIIETVKKTISEEYLNKEREELEQAHMAGQKECGIDPSYSDAQNHVTNTYNYDNKEI